MATLEAFDVNSPTNVSTLGYRSRPDADIRREILSLYVAGKVVMEFVVWHALDKQLGVLEYALAVPSRKKRHPVDVELMVGRWVEAIVGMALAHSKDEVDKWEAQLNSLLEPFLKAPVVQIREFCTKLMAAMEGDPKVPWLITKSTVAYIKIFVEGAEDKGILELKKDIAMRIARAVEGDVQPQRLDAIANALMWRDPKKLEEIEEATKKAKRSGKRAKLVGRESCLFLEVEGECVQL